MDVELKSYDKAGPFPFGNLTVRDMTPDSFTELSMAIVEIPIGAEHPPFAEHRKEKIYIVLEGELQFTSGEETLLATRGDVLVFAGGEQYSYHNGGYSPGKLLVLQRPNRDV
jgi:mannose-6-phosphate isomerase-like protein (cupin superfamily)